MTHAHATPARIRLAVATVLMAVAALSASVAPASADTFVQTSTGKVNVVDAGGSSLGGDGCTVTDWAINAGKNSDGSFQISYARSEFNFCFGEQVSVRGVTTEGVVEFDPSGLKSAHVKGTIPLFSTASGAPAGQVVIDQTFRGVGSVSADQSHLDLGSGNVILKITSSGRTRQAVGSGSPAIDFAVLAAGTSATVFIIKDCC